MEEDVPIPHPSSLAPEPHSRGRTYVILRLWALLKPAKEALRPMTPTAPASPEDRNRTLTDMAVTCRERTGQSASHWHPVSADLKPATLHCGPQSPDNHPSGRAAGTVSSSQMRKLTLKEVREPNPVVITKPRCVYSAPGSLMPEHVPGRGGPATPELALLTSPQLLLNNPGPPPQTLTEYLLCARD